MIFESTPIKKAIIVFIHPNNANEDIFTQVHKHINKNWIADKNITKIVVNTPLNKNMALTEIHLMIEIYASEKKIKANHHTAKDSSKNLL